MVNKNFAAVSEKNGCLGYQERHVNSIGKVERLAEEKLFGKTVDVTEHLEPSPCVVLIRFSHSNDRKQPDPASGPG